MLVKLIRLHQPEGLPMPLVSRSLRKFQVTPTGEISVYQADGQATSPSSPCPASGGLEGSQTKGSPKDVGLPSTSVKISHPWLPAGPLRSDFPSAKHGHNSLVLFDLPCWTTKKVCRMPWWIWNDLLYHAWIILFVSMYYKYKQLMDCWQVEGITTKLRKPFALFFRLIFDWCLLRISCKTK